MERRVIKKIAVPRGVVPALTKEMQVTRACVFNALAFVLIRCYPKQLERKLLNMVAL